MGWYKNGKAGTSDGTHNPGGDKLVNPEIFQVTNYINDLSTDNEEVLMTSDVDGNYRGVYTYDNNYDLIGVEDLGEIQGKPNDPIYYLKDALGSVTSITNMNAGIIDSNRFAPYGEELDPVAKNARLTNSPYGFTGESQDIEGGLVYLRARYYEPETMRFLQQDTVLGDIKQPLSRNLYIYTNANPLKYVDPSGNMVETDHDETKLPTTEIDDGVVTENYAKTHPIKEELQIGSTGIYVTVLQKELEYRGYFVLPSTGSYGYYGNITYTSVWNYQGDNKLYQDGKVYKETWKSLFPQAYNSSANEGVIDPTPVTPVAGETWGTGSSFGDFKTIEGTSYPNLYVNGKYDRAAAVAYATNPAYSSPDKNEPLFGIELPDALSFLDINKHTRNYNHDFERYDSYDYYLKGHGSGSDCANFVSQSLFAGGIKQSDGWYFKWNTIDGSLGSVNEPQASTSWIRPEAQLDYLKKNGYVNGDVITVNSLEALKSSVANDGLQVGDLIYFKDSNDGIHHSVMITSISSDGTVKFSGHSNDRINQPITDDTFTGNGGVAETMYIVRMK